MKKKRVKSQLIFLVTIVTTSETFYKHSWFRQGDRKGLFDFIYHALQLIIPYRGIGVNSGMR